MFSMRAALDCRRCCAGLFTGNFMATGVACSVKCAFPRARVRTAFGVPALLSFTKRAVSRAARGSLTIWRRRQQGLAARRDRCRMRARTSSVSKASRPVTPAAQLMTTIRHALRREPSDLRRDRCAGALSALLPRGAHPRSPEPLRAREDKPGLGFALSRFLIRLPGPEVASLTTAAEPLNLGQCPGRVRSTMVRPLAVPEAEAATASSPVPLPSPRRRRYAVREGDETVNSALPAKANPGMRSPRCGARAIYQIYPRSFLSI